MKNTTLAAIGIASVVTATTGGIYAYKTIYPTYKIKEIVRASLRDPGSAEFRLVRIHKDSSAACGTVNSKNGLGGYTGDIKFVITSIGKLEFAPETETRECTKPELPRMPNVSFSNPLAASIGFDRSVNQYKEKSEVYLSCLKTQLAILETRKAFLDQYVNLCPDSEKS